MTEEIIRMEAMRRQLVARLGALVDLTYDPDSLRIAAPGFELELPAADSLIRVALARRPALLAGRSELTAAAAAQSQADRETWPDVEFGVQYGWRPMDEGTDQMLSLVVGANLPIFAGRKQNRMKDEARVMAAMAGEEVRGLEAETRGWITMARERYLEAQRLRRVYREELLPQARAALRAAASAYSVGEVDWMTWLDNQMTVNRYRQELYQLAAAQGTALAELEELTGVSFAGTVSEEE
jgi:outer membrane protein TolC